MAQSFARFGRIANVPSAATGRLEFSASATVKTWVPDAGGFGTHIHTNEYGHVTDGLGLG
ncbi:hypothetical protein MFM001_46620 [Mycobacterium sp. MFM001]|nr:hypothetical protein MFM001_46620 [Mycobacterium sp. MFM001]